MKKIHNISEFNIYFSEDAILGLGICVSPNSADVSFVLKHMNVDKLLQKKSNDLFMAKKKFYSKIYLEDLETEKVKAFIFNDSIAYGRYDLKEFSLIKINKSTYKIIYSYKSIELTFDLSIDEICKILF